MNKPIKITAACAIMLVTMVSLRALAADPVTPKLTEKLSMLLQQEMRAIQSAMANIHTAMITGDHKAVASGAQQIHDSFILQQSLTDQDRQDLMSAVPGEFVELDKIFHERASLLAEAGREENTDKQHQLYSDMTRNCIQCHESYVSDRFPGITVAQ